MTEARVEYVTRTTRKAKYKRCHGCQSVFGEEASDGSYLDTGRVLVTVLRGRCRGCGREITWYAVDRHIRRIEEKARKRKR
jgi:hypothetical protein